ncbi:YveK family protein [Tsukamurella soli]|uniref:Capsular polysaccharide biosynthesis protein n=1 Tax=Tsukamurella soli TaxID=644556 RepID=A0ABP8JWX9_9ACTN
MNVAEFFRSLVRRPIGLGIVIVLAIAAGAYGYASTTVKYTSSAAVLVIPPGAGNPDAGLNPFSNLNNNMAQLAIVIETAAQGDDAKQQVAATGASPDYTMSTVSGDSPTFAQLTPQIVIQVTGATPGQAEAGANALIDFMRTRLLKIQNDAGVLPTTRVDFRVPSQPAPGSPSGGNGLRSAVGYGGGVLIVGILVLLVITAAVQSLRRKVDGGQADTGEADRGQADSERAATDDGADAGAAATDGAAADDAATDDAADPAEKQVDDALAAEEGTATQESTA